MGTAALGDFIREHRAELLLRCREKVAKRSAGLFLESEIERGIPRFLDDIVGELKDGSSHPREMGARATQHGADLFFGGCTVGQVVHDYGDVCQSVTDLAVELGASISSDDFRTLNRCLDEAIAHAVGEYGRQQRATVNDYSLYRLITLRNLIHTALDGFEALQTGTIAVGGTTGSLVHRSLLEIRSLVTAASVPPAVGVD